MPLDVTRVLKRYERSLTAVSAKTFLRRTRAWSAGLATDSGVAERTATAIMQAMKVMVFHKGDILPANSVPVCLVAFQSASRATAGPQNPSITWAAAPI